MFKIAKNVLFLTFVFLVGSLNITLASTETSSAACEFAKVCIEN